MTATYTDTHPDGSIIRVDQAQPGYLVAMNDGPGGELWCGIVTDVRGGGVWCRGRDDGRHVFVSHGRTYGLARPETCTRSPR